MELLNSIMKNQNTREYYLKMISLHKNDFHLPVFDPNYHIHV